MALTMKQEYIQWMVSRHFLSQRDRSSAALDSWRVFRRLFTGQLEAQPGAARAGRFTVYAYDQPGFGHTENPSDHSIEYRVSHAKEFINP